MKSISLTIHEKLSHLSQEQINELCCRYEAGESNKSLIKEFDRHLQFGFAKTITSKNYK